jgi:hypothetical protein
MYGTCYLAIFDKINELEHRIAIYFPVYFFSNHLKAGKVNAEKANVISWPILAPFFPISSAIGPANQAIFMPRAAPRNPKQNAPIAPQPNGSRSCLLQASRSYRLHLPPLKMTCSSATTTICMTVQYPIMLRNVWRVASGKNLAAQQPTMTAAIKPTVTSTTRGIRKAHGPKF